MKVDDYLEGLAAAWLESGPFGFLLVVVWLLFPVAFVTCFHPADAVGFQLWLQGFVVPSVMSSQAMNAGEAVALLALGVLFLLQLGIITMIYHRAQFFIQLWPLGLFLIGFIGNGIWWMAKGYFDPMGAIAGLMPLVAAVVSQGICERLGGNFVFGSGAKPAY
jgi:hypothetical protein